MRFRGIEIFLRRKDGRWFAGAFFSDKSLIFSGERVCDAVALLKRDLLWWEAATSPDPCGIVEVRGGDSCWSLQSVYLNQAARDFGPLPLSLNLGLLQDSYWPMLAEQGFYRIVLSDRLFTSELVGNFRGCWAIERFSAASVIPTQSSVLCPGPALQTRRP